MLSTTMLRLAAVVQLAISSSAFQFITSDTLPSDSLSPGCVEALLSDIACARQVAAFLPGTYKSVEVLDESCTSDCAAALARYQAAAEASCDPVTDMFQTSETREAPASFLPQVLYYNFNRTCISDEGRWCNNYAKEIAEGNSSVSVTGWSTSNDTVQVRGLIFGRQDIADPCDNCVIKQLQFQAGSPLNNGFLLQSRYSSLTSSCSKTGFPLSSSTTPFESGPMPTDPAGECAGSKYQVQSGDTCRSISLSQGIGTAWLLYDNGLPAFCAEFPASGSLCIQNTCRVYTVQVNDTCASIAKGNHMSEVQLLTWNPILGEACNAIGRSVGDSICISPPGDPSNFTNPTFTTSSPAPPPTAVPVPDNVAQGTNTNCGQYHLVEKGEYCNLIVVKFSISMDDFLFLNKGVNSNCTNLFAQESYCVRPVGPIDQYPGHPDYIATTLPPGGTTVPFDSLPKATFTPPAITGLPVKNPLAKGTRTDCYLYVNAEDLELPFNLDDTWFESACDALAQGFAVTLEELNNWNPSLQTNSTSCAPEPGFRYCMAAWNDASYTRPAPTAAEPTPSLLPIREGAAENCRDYASVTYGMTCQNVLDRTELTIAQFYEWNPAVGDQCQGLWTGYRYCIRTDDVPFIPDPSDTTGGSSPTPTSSAPETGPTAPAPVQDGIAGNCEKWHVAGDGLFCYDIAEKYEISINKFLEWNPALDENCNGLWAGYAYCVGVSS